jgi:hypothetical protein
MSWFIEDETTLELTIVGTTEIGNVCEAWFTR